MIVTFCGHSDFVGNPQWEERVLSALETHVGGAPVDFYLGGYGGFDRFAEACCRRYRELHPGARLILVTPYLTSSDSHGSNASEYDEIIYPGLERVPPRYAIVHRNRWMVERADLLIAYVTHRWGGAFGTLQRAKRVEIPVVNLALEGKSTDFS